MASWYKLPPELRNMILRIVAESHSYRTAPKARAGYAVVSREWNWIFEKINFQRVSLNYRRAQDFKKMFLGENIKRRRHLKYLQVLFVLEEYNCSSCETPEDDATRKRNQKSLTETLWSVLKTISEWEESSYSQQNKRQLGLAIELGAYSPSDSKHFFRDFRLERTYPYIVTRELDKTFEGYNSWIQLKPNVDEFHGWANGERQRPPPINAKRRLLGSAPLLHDFYGFDRRRNRRFPQAMAITSLIITRQFYRSFDPRLIGNLIKNCFPRLRHFRHEWWYSVDLKFQRRYEHRYKRFLLPHLPPTLRELYLYEESSLALHGDMRIRSAAKSVAIRLRNASRNLKHLSASFIISAKHFFGMDEQGFQGGVDFKVYEGWPKLQTLALSTTQIVPIRRQSERLLEFAARAALLMPKLMVMELWGVYEGHGAIFCYDARGKNAPHILMKFTDANGLKIRVGPQALELWKRVARRHGHGELVVKSRLIKMTKLERGHNFVVETFLKSRILSELSLYQQHWESRHPLNC